MGPAPYRDEARKFVPSCTLPPLWGRSTTSATSTLNIPETWKVAWPSDDTQKLAPQVIPVNYLRWDVINRGAEDDWGVQNVDAPQVRIVSMNAGPGAGPHRDHGRNRQRRHGPGLRERQRDAGRREPESGWPKRPASTRFRTRLLPRQVSPYRIDFPGAKL